MQDLLRRLLQPLRFSPLHPQWFCFRDESSWLQRAASSATGTVLDVGCGRQRVRPFLAPACRYVGVDYPQTAVAMYHTRPDVFADGTQLPLSDASVDTVLVLEVLEHIPDAEAVVREAARVLRPGGTLVLSVPFLYPVHDAPYDFHRWTPAGIRDLLQRQGFGLEWQQAIGRPLVTSALLFNLAVAAVATELLSRRSPLVLLALPACALAVPLANLAAWALQWAGPGADFMPFTSRAIARRAPLPDR